MSHSTITKASCKKRDLFMECAFVSENKQFIGAVFWVINPRCSREAENRWFNLIDIIYICTVPVTK